MIRSNLELSFVLVAVFVILLSIIPFQLQLTAATWATSTTQPNATIDPTLPSMKLFQISTNSSLVVGDINATNLTQKQELISSHIQQHQPGSIQSQPQQQPPLSQSQQLPPQQQQQPLTQPQPPTQQQQTILPEGMRPVLLDNLKYSPTVLATLNLEEKLTLVVQTYNYCGNPPGGVLPGQDGEKCRQFLSLLDQTLINMLSLQ
jgi:hypothetical protein